MGCGKYDISSTCGDRYYATCTFYQTELPEWSELKDQNCVTIEETTEELYEAVTEIKDQLDNSELSGGCIEYPNSDPAQNEVNAAVQEKLCEIVQQLEDFGSPSNGVFCPNLDYGNLVDPDDCDGKPTTWCEFAQFVLNQLKTNKGFSEEA